MKLRKKLDLNNPRTINEKFQWLKLYDRNSDYIKLVDKYAVREYIKETIGEKYLVPLLGVWECFEDIDFDTLPDRFVLKCNHDSHSAVIVKDKSMLDMKAAGRKLRRHLRRNYYRYGREWPYRFIKPRIMAEQFLDDGFGLIDYKFYSFSGEVKLVLVATGRQSDSGVFYDYFDADFNHLPFSDGVQNTQFVFKPPVMFDEMKRLASELSKGLIHARVDFYEVDGRVFFSEITLTDGSGYNDYQPEEWAERLGDYIMLPPAPPGGVIEGL